MIFNNKPVQVKGIFNKNLDKCKEEMLNLI